MTEKDYEVSSEHPKRIFFFSGAGLSAESGISTFRKNHDGTKALWDEYDIEEVCNIKSFLDFYEKTNEFYNLRRSELANVNPNNAHLVMAELEKQYGSERVVHITMNVDDLLEKAGCTNVFHVHGNIKEVIENYINNPLNKPKNIGYEKVDYQNKPHGYFKPNVTFFHEYIGDSYSKLYNMMANMRKGKDILVVVGTSFKVVPIEECIWQYKIDAINLNIEHYEDGRLNPFRMEVIERASSGMNKLKRYLNDYMES